MLSMFKKVQAAVHVLTDTSEDVEEYFSWEDEPILVRCIDLQTRRGL